MKRNAKKSSKASKTLNVEMAASAAILAAAKDVLAAGGGFPGIPGVKGTDKVFLCEVYDRLAPLNPGLTLAGLKALCVELHFASELSLCRCDLVEAFSATIVDRSEVEHDYCTFHFVRVD